MQYLVNPVFFRQLIEFGVHKIEHVNHFHGSDLTADLCETNYIAK